MKRLYTDRSRIETHQSCHRKRYYEYELDGRGIVPARKPLPLAVGGAVHAGLAVLLEHGASAWPWDTDKLRTFEDAAVAVALADFAEFAGGALEVDVNESSAMVARGGGNTLDDIAGEEAAAGIERALPNRSDFDDYLYREQASLVEGLVRAYARRRLRPLLEQFDVLDVEREGMWLLSEAQGYSNDHPRRPYDSDGYTPELYFMSRPDALLLDRTSRELYLLSFKTAATWDARKARDAEHDMQGLSEGVEVERRLAEYWTEIYVGKVTGDEAVALMGRTMYEYMRMCPAPPRIHAIRYEYLLKGERRADKSLSARLGFDARSQASHLTRGYLSAGMTAADATWNWSYDYIKPDGAESKLYYKSWPSTPVFEHMTTREWIDLLDTAHANDVGAYECAAQASGATRQHPLDAPFLPPVVVYRQDDELRDWIEQVEAQERRVAEASAEVSACEDEGDRRHALNVHFPMTRRACFYPSQCAFVALCYGGEDIRKDPVASGLYAIRVPNHPMESEKS